VFICGVYLWRLSVAFICGVYLCASICGLTRAGS